MEILIKELIDRLKGTILYMEKHLEKFSRDMSIYRIQPLAVVLPDDEDDIVTAVRLAADAGISLTPRGGGSGTAGAGLGSGLMIAHGRRSPMNRVHRFNETADGPEISVDTGIIHQRLQDYLKERGYFLPADPSSGEISSIGGNIATKASGPHALKHGSIDRYLKHIRFIDSTARFIDTAVPSTIPPELIEGVQALRKDIMSDRKTFSFLNRRKNRKIASGYNLFAFLKDLPVEELIAQLLVGSVGTLGIITGAILRAEPVVPGKATLAISFRDLHEAGEAVRYIRQLDVAAIEIISKNSIRLARERRKNAFDSIAADGHLLLIELEGETRFEQAEAVKTILTKRRYTLEAEPLEAMEPARQAELWKHRKQLLPAVLNYKPHLKALSLVNDVGIEVDRLPDFILAVEKIFKTHGLHGAIYGHAGSGNLHLRPLIDIRRPDLEAFIQHVADDVYDAVLKHDGTITAEHGMGRLRAPYLEAEWGSASVGYMKRLKSIFDPKGILNPDVIFSRRPLTDHMFIQTHDN